MVRIWCAHDTLLHTVVITAIEFVHLLTPRIHTTMKWSSFKSVSACITEYIFGLIVCIYTLCDVNLSQKSETNVTSMKCFRCPKIGHLSRLEELKDKNQLRVCCLKEEDKLQETINELLLLHLKQKPKIREKSIKPKTPDVVNGLTPILHTPAIYNLERIPRNKVQSLKLPVVRIWINPHYYGARNNMEFHKGMIRVIMSGTYYVYSNMIFSPEMTQTPSKSPGDVFVHQLVRYDAGNEQAKVIHENRQSHCESYFRYLFREYSSYIGRVVGLRAGDCLAVKVSDVEQIKHENTKQYFGTFLISA